MEKNQKKKSASAKSLQLCTTLCSPMDYSPPGNSVNGILQARKLECVAMPSAGDLPNPGIKPVSLTSPALAGMRPLGSPTGVHTLPIIKSNQRWKAI